MQDSSNKIALVTGANKGIGFGRMVIRVFLVSWPAVPIGNVLASNGVAIPFPKAST